MRVAFLIVAFAVLASLPGQVLGYEFTEYTPVSDSVRLSYNAGLSHDDIVAIDVVAGSVPSIRTIAFDLFFDPSVILWEGTDSGDPDGFSKGDFFGSSAWYSIDNSMDADQVLDEGRLVAAAGDPYNPVSGSGTFMTILFRIVGTGETTFSYMYNNLIEPDGGFTSSTWLEGTLKVDSVPVYEPPQDETPLVTLFDPADGTVLTEEDVTLSCSADDDYGVASISLFTDVSGSWSEYDSVTGNDAFLMGAFELTGLTDGTYAWNCLAYDDNGRSSWGSEDFQFTVNLPSDPDPPVISGGSVSGDLENGSITISVDTDEPATCRYSANPGIPYSMMIWDFTTTGSYSHDTNITTGTNKSYIFRVRCQDSTGNANEEDYEIQVSLGDATEDNEPPVMLGLLPSTDLGYGTGHTIISITTEEEAECRISETSGNPFDSMEMFAVTGMYNHTHTLVGLMEGTEYTYYMRCRNNAGNENQEQEVTFFVCYESDSDCSRTVDLSELSGYIDRWYANSRDVPMRRVMEAIRLWRSGSA